MTYPEKQPADPALDQLEMARRDHADALSAYLCGPHRATRLELGWATEVYEKSLCSFHNVNINELAVTSQEREAYFEHFHGTMASTDERDTNIARGIARAIAIFATLGYLRDKVDGGDLYFRSTDLVFSVVFATSLLWQGKTRENASAKPNEQELVDPIELTRDILSSPVSRKKHTEIDLDGTEINRHNARREARRKLLSGRRRALSTLVGHY